MGDQWSRAGLSPAGGCLGSHSTTGGDGGWAADGSDRASSIHERQCTPPGDLFSESPQKAVPVTSGCEARSSRTTSRITSPSRPGLPRHPTISGEVPISGLRDLSLPSPQAAALIVPRQGNPACQEGQLKSRQSWEPGK